MTASTPRSPLRRTRSPPPSTRNSPSAPKRGTRTFRCACVSASTRSVHQSVPHGRGFDRRLGKLAAALGDDRCAILLEQGASMSFDEVGDLCRAELDRIIEDVASSP